MIDICVHLYSSPVGDLRPPDGDLGLLDGDLSPTDGDLRPPDGDLSSSARNVSGPLDDGGLSVSLSSPSCTSL